MGNAKVGKGEWVDEEGPSTAPDNFTASLVLTSGPESTGVIGTSLQYSPQVQVTDWGEIEAMPAAYKVMVELVMYMHNLLGSASYGNKLTQLEPSKAVN
jgi:hypothetical protein